MKAFDQTATLGGVSQHGLVARVPPPPNLPSRRELLNIAAACYRQRSETYPTLRNVEDMPLKSLRALSTIGTPFERAADKLIALGYMTEPKMGQVMDVLGLEQHHVDRLACFCDHGSEVSARCMTEHFDKLARPSIAEQMRNFFNPLFLAVRGR